MSSNRTVYPYTPLGTSGTESGILAAVFLVIVISSFYTVWLAWWVLQQPTGSPKMIQVWEAIREGSAAFVKVQYTAMAKLVLPMALFIFLVFAFVREEPVVEGDEKTNPWLLAFWSAMVFMFGAFFSGLTGLLGMYIANQTNVRACAAAEHSLNAALITCFRGGAFNGMIITNLSVLSVAISYCIVRAAFKLSPTNCSSLLVGLGFGASFVALFAQLGGGIYTKAADVGADLVGKNEKALEEDDVRNPAVVADLVGDNVGDCAGRGADLYESMTAETIGAMILGGAVARGSGAGGGGIDENEMFGFILFPLLVRAAGLACAMIAIVLVVSKRKDRGLRLSDFTSALSKKGALGEEPTTPLANAKFNRSDEEKGDDSSVDTNESPMSSLLRAYVICLILSATAFFILAASFLKSSQHPTAWINYFACGVVGLVLSFAFVVITRYYTDTDYGPVRRIAAAAADGSGPVVIHGLAVGMESTFLPVIAIGAALIITYWLGASSGITGDSPEDRTSAGIYGTAVGTMGMLCTVVFVLAMDTFGPISDNAGGIAEMSQSPPKIRERTDKLDAVGNTTKALTKGYAVGSAGLATFLLFRAYLDEVFIYTNKPQTAVVDLAVPEVFVSALWGVMFVFFFSSLAMRAVGDAAHVVIVEVRRQLTEFPGILTWEQKPDYAACVAIVTKASLRRMAPIGLMSVAFPIVWGLILRGLGAAQGSSALAGPALAAFMMAVTIGGICVGLFLNNAGGAWDNAKKYIATGPGQPGKASEDHKAVVTGDTVGDPCKDTAGPSLHVLVKLISTLALLLFPLFIPQS